MSLNIKSEEAERLVRELARTTGETLTGAITVALRERLERVKGRPREQVDATWTRLREISVDAAGRWATPYRHAQHGDLLYDESGLPR